MIDERYSGHRSGENFAIASLVLGIMSIMFGLFTGVGGVGLGSLGIILAVISRGPKRMLTQAKIGLGTSIGGMILGALVVAGAAAFMMSSQFQEQLDKELERYGGEYHFNSEIPEEDDFYDMSPYEDFLNGI